MSIPSKQIGWGTEEYLLQQISKQLEYLTRVAYTAGTVPSPSLIPSPSDFVTTGYLGDNIDVPDYTLTTISYNQMDDPQGWWTGTSFRPTVAGYYLINYSALWSVGGTIGQNYLQVRSDTLGTIGMSQRDAVTNSKEILQSGSVTTYMNGVDDEISIKAYSSSDVPQYIINGSGTIFSAILIQ